jgi:hypothetical protein
VCYGEGGTLHAERGGVCVFKSMTKVMKEVHGAIRKNKPAKVHPNMYSVMEFEGFSQDILMVGPNHLMYKKALSLILLALTSINKEPLACSLQVVMLVFRIGNPLHTWGTYTPINF